MAIHTSRNGENVPCFAPPGECPLGGPHYETMDQADSALAERMDDSLFAPGAAVAPKTDPSTMKLSELSQAVKDSNEPEVLDAGIERGSNRTHKNMLKNQNVSADQLKALREKSDSDEIRKGALHHKNFAVENMTSDEFAQVALNDERGGWSTGPKARITDNAVDDEKFEAYVAEAERRKRNPKINQALANPDNKLTSETVYRHASKSWTTSGDAIRSGRLSPEQIESLPENAVYWGDVDRSSDPKALEGYGNWAVKNGGDKGEYIAGRVARNKNTSTETLDQMGNAGMGGREVYANENTSPEVRNKIRTTNPEVGRVARIMDLEREHGSMKAQIVTESNVSRPYSGAPYSTTVVKLDKEKIAKYNLSPEEVREVMGSRGYNAGSTYNAADGTFVGKVDSSG